MSQSSLEKRSTENAKSINAPSRNSKRQSHQRDIHVPLVKSTNHSSNTQPRSIPASPPNANWPCSCLKYFGKVEGLYINAKLPAKKPDVQSNTDIQS